MVSIWQTLDEDYRLYLAHICTPEEFNASPLAERAQLWNAFLEESRSSYKTKRLVSVSNVKVEDDSMSVLDPVDLNIRDGDDDSDNVKTREHARDEQEKHAPHASLAPSKRRKFSVRMKSSNGTYEFPDNDIELEQSSIHWTTSLSTELSDDKACGFTSSCHIYGNDISDKCITQHNVETNQADSITSSFHIDKNNASSQCVHFSPHHDTGHLVERNLFVPTASKTAKPTRCGLAKFFQATKYRFDMFEIAPPSTFADQPRSLLTFVAIALGLRSPTDGIGFPDVTFATPTASLFNLIHQLAPTNGPVVVRSARSTLPLTCTLSDANDLALPEVPKPNAATVQVITFSLGCVPGDPKGIPTDPFMMHVGYISGHLFPAHPYRYAVTLGTKFHYSLCNESVKWLNTIKEHCFKFSNYRNSYSRNVTHVRTDYFWVETRQPVP